MNPDPDPTPPGPATLIPRRFRSGWLVAGWLLALVAFDLRLPPTSSRPLELDVEMDSSTDSVAQVFYDTGKGFNALETGTAPVAAGTSSQTLVFPLPPATVRALRFDPLNVPGTVHVRSAAVRTEDGHETVRAFDLGKVAPLSEIASLTPGADRLEVVTTPDSHDSQLTFPVTSPFDTRPTLVQDAIYWIGIDASVTILTLVALGIVFLLGPLLWPRIAPKVRPAAAPFRWLDRRFASWAGKLSRPEIARIDRWVFWFYGICALVFGLMAVAGLHGSSEDEYVTQFPWSGVKDAPLLGQPQGIRSDEWAVQTPAFLNQVLRRDKLATETSSLGKGSAALLLSVPCRDFTQVFRPEFWPFHVLPIQAAFPVYWQCKGFILLTGVFSLLLLLTRGHTGLAALGALWLFFSAHIQWAYSWPSMLPEMIGLFGWTITLTLYLCVGKNRFLLAAAAVAGAVCALDFAFCFYPPHQIPFVLFGALLMPAWLWAHRTHVLRRDMVPRRLCALAACWGLVVVVLGLFVLEARPALVAAANTVYPGLRVSSGGGVPIEALLSDFFDFWKSETRFPPPQGNVCEAVGFLWLLPVTLLAAGRWRSGRAGGWAVLAACWAAFALVGAWLVFPVPARIGHWLLFDHVFSPRCLPALGLVNIVGVIVYLSWPSAGTAPSDRWTTFRRVAIYAAVLLGVTVSLIWVSRVYQSFFLGKEIALAAMYAALLMVCVFERWKVSFAVTLLVPLICAFGLINPVERGLRVVNKSPLYREVQGHPYLLEGRWLVYSHDFTLTGFVVATGADVFNSFKVVPDLQAMSVFDPERRCVNSYNQSGHTVVHPLPVGQPCRFENPDVGLLLWSVSPLDPALRTVGIRFLVFDEMPDPSLIPGLRHIAAEVPGIWIYELP